jgi:hypothetical protein
MLVGFVMKEGRILRNCLSFVLLESPSTLVLLIFMMKYIYNLLK